MNNLSKKIVCLLAIVSLFSFSKLQAQDKYVTDISEVYFFSSTPIEDIEAVNADLKGIIVEETSEFSFRIPIKSFVFDKSLMQEHFNENYMESDRYPNATFKGKIEGDYSLKKDGVYALEAVGDLEIHGVKNKVSLPATIVVENGFPSIQCTFKVALADYNIEVPKIVFYKIAEDIEVKVEAGLRLY